MTNQDIIAMPEGSKSKLIRAWTADKAVEFWLPRKASLDAIWQHARRLMAPDVVDNWRIVEWSEKLVIDLPGVKFSGREESK